MTTFKRGNHWMYEFMEKGQRYTKGGYEKKSQASAAEADHRKRLKSQQGDMGLLTLMTLRTEYLEKQKTEQYFHENRKILKDFYDHMGNVMCSAITKPTLREYIGSFSDTPYMANYRLRVIAAMFNHGVKHEWITANPAKGIPLLKCDRKRKYIPPEEDIEKVLAVAPPHERAFLLTLKNTLARVSEVCHLQWDDVDLKARQIALWTRKKARGELTHRLIPMTDELFELLRSLRYDWCAHHEGEPRGQVFINPSTGKPYENWSKMLKRLTRQAGVKYFSWHSLRHWGASTLIHRGVPLSDLQAILGHENLTTTALYVQSLVGSTTKSIHLLNGESQPKSQPPRKRG